MSVEIKNCIYDNIIVIASASNDGGEGSHTYPARLPNVICAHAASCYGNKYDRNPTPGKEELDFSLVGEDVRPIWPSKVSKQPEGMQYRVRDFVCGSCRSLGGGFHDWI